MKAVILAGGYGTRLSEETNIRPKPMVEIGGRPILWHIMKTYYAHGIREFIVCCGYKGGVIKEYFHNYLLQSSDFTIDMSRGASVVHHRRAESWKVTLVDTGAETMTGGRLRRVREYLDGDTFCMTYGDGLSDVDITRLVTFHRKHGLLATLTAAHPPGRFGAFTLSADSIHVPSFQEKPRGDGAWINGGFFVLEPAVLDYIEGDQTTWEQEPLERLARENQLAAYRHDGFWQPMDTLRDKMTLEELWRSHQAPWKVWDDEKPELSPTRNTARRPGGARRRRTQPGFASAPAPVRSR